MTSDNSALQIQQCYQAGANAVIVKAVNYSIPKNTFQSVCKFWAANLHTTKGIQNATNVIYTYHTSWIKCLSWNPKIKTILPARDQVVKKSLASGRNANDNFQQDTEDDHGIDKSAPDADQQLEERDEIKGEKVKGAR
ncbi:hypothetical protein [Dyadobacter psychrotolerans]|uniref:Uncharacterized protein n=1 Tax=Dyadobacter psychrotolerans TaxID=2541721 RepID=A0A4R5DEF4_9BACT|nr:hypothetical protein [Dyadobacter psychrotolerans]TDE08985.1 hypothetical protein E0F88_31350 [Dyadobacter psychrotolerans]